VQKAIFNRGSMRFPRRRAALLPDYEVNLSGLGQVASPLFYFSLFIFTPLQVPVFTTVEGAGITRTRTSTYPSPEIIQRTVDAFSRAQIVGWLAKAATPRDMVPSQIRYPMGRTARNHPPQSPTHYRAYRTSPRGSHFFLQPDHRRTVQYRAHYPETTHSPADVFHPPLMISRA
jgi:hypothetical protein